MRYALLNLSSASNDDMAKIGEAMQIFLGLVCDAHGRKTSIVEFMPGVKVAPAGYSPMAAIDNPDVGGVIAYHELDPNGNPYSRAFLDMVPGRCVLRDPSGRGASLAAALMHEAAEAELDAFANFWSDGPIRIGGKSYDQVALEIADMVQESAFPITLKSGEQVDGSNFATPEWFNPRSQASKFDHLGILTAPLTIAPGGYAIVRGAGGVSSIFGRRKVRKVEHHVKQQPWRADMKAAPGGRTKRRLAA